MLALPVARPDKLLFIYFFQFFFSFFFLFCFVVSLNSRFKDGQLIDFVIYWLLVSVALPVAQPDKF